MSDLYEGTDPKHPLGPIDEIDYRTKDIEFKPVEILGKMYTRNDLYDFVRSISADFNDADINYIFDWLSKRDKTQILPDIAEAIRDMYRSVQFNAMDKRAAFIRVLSKTNTREATRYE